MSQLAATRGNQKYRHTTEDDAALLKKHRPYAERFIGLFDNQFNQRDKDAVSELQQLCRKTMGKSHGSQSVEMYRQRKWLAENSVTRMRKIS